MGGAASCRANRPGFRYSRIDPQSAAVERMLQQEAEREKNHFKILLLGAGESGKSTVLKQLRLLSRVPVSREELKECTRNIRCNAVECFKIVLEAMDTLGIALADPALETAKQSVLAVDLAAFAYNLRLVSTLDALQKDAGFQECFQRRDEYWIMDAVDYYLEHKARFAESEFQPTEEDIVMARVRTTGIVVSIIEEPPARFSIVDVGGQRSERRKWIHCFDDVKAIVFLSGLSGYNQVLFEDSSTNRLAESLTLFEDIVKNPAFATTPLYLLLNKKDLFEQMISKHELKKAFPDYSGPEGKVLPAAEFISNKFRAIAKRHRPSHPPAVHIVAARVRMDMKTFFKELKADLRGKRGHNNTTRGVLGKHG